MKKILAMFLVIILTVCSVPIDVVYAEESIQAENSLNVEQNTNEENDNINLEQNPNHFEEIIEDDNIQAENNEEQNEEDALEESLDESIMTDNKELESITDAESVEESENLIVEEEKTESKDDTEEIQSEVLSEDNLINYVYVESPVVNTPGTQRIVFSLQMEIKDNESVYLKVANDAGEVEEWEVKSNINGVFLFEKEFVQGVYEGRYYADAIFIRNEENEKVIKLIERNIIAEFGVNKEYSGIEELQPMINDEDDTENFDEGIVKIDEAESNSSQNKITKALENVDDQMLAQGTGFRSAESTINAREEYAKTGNIVVALDPGHDNRDAGAHRNGLKEEELTLKIAQYCKQELEKYSGVTVYMTRTGPECPYNKPGIQCMPDRVQGAARAGAKMFVSLHLNSSDSSTAYGAEIIIPNNSWKPQLGTEGREIAKKIMAELVALGLSERNIYSKDTTINEHYPDGSKSDYFNVQICCKEQGIPGLIVEHAFISNANEANKYLKTEAGLKSLGVADAVGIANYLGLKKVGEKVNIKEGTYTISSILDSNKTIQIENNSLNNGAQTCLSSKNNDNSAQRFEVYSAGNGFFHIVAEHSGKALQVINKGGGYYSIEQRDRNDNLAEQKWSFVSAGNGEYFIQSASNIAMDVKYGSTSEGTIIWGYPANQSMPQKWRLNVSNYQPIKNGTYKISNVSNKSLGISITNQSIDNMANIYLNHLKTDSTQAFEVTYVGEGYYKILSDYSGKSLDIRYGSNVSGANLQQYEWNGSPAQLWKFVKAENGGYYIRSKLGTTISIQSEKISAGANIHLANISRNNTQKWTFIDYENKSTEEGQYVIMNAGNSNNVISIMNGNAELGSNNYSSNQIFDIKYAGGGYYKITSALTGKSLDVFGGSDRLGANLQEYPWNGSSAQLWRFVENADGTLYIKSKLGTCIDVFGGGIVPGQNVQMYVQNGSIAQKWKLKKVEKNVEIQDGIYTLQTALSDNLVLDIANASIENCANAWIYSQNGTAAQKFKITKVTGQYYKIENLRSRKVLDVSNASRENGANVWQYEWNGSDAQLWKFIEAGDGKFYIKSKLGKVLDVFGANANDGTNVQTYNLNGTKAQKWELVPTSAEDVAMISDGIYKIASKQNSLFTVDIANGSVDNGGNVWIYSDNGTHAQKFRITHKQGEYYKIENVRSGKVLDVANASKENGTNVWQYEWNGSDAQLWKFVNTGDGNYYIQSKLGTVLDISGDKVEKETNVQTAKLKKNITQQWKLIPTQEDNEIFVQNGVYQIKTSLSDNRVLDVTNGRKDNKANVWIYSHNGSSAQKFRITLVKDGYYKIENINSGKVLDIANASNKNGANVWQYEWNKSDAQLWRFIDAGNGQVYIQSKLGTVLDVSGASIDLGTNVQAYKKNNSDAQKWTLDSQNNNLYAIMGKAGIRISQMVKFYKLKSKVEYPYRDVQEAPSIEKFCEIFYEECEMEGVRSEVAFAQAMMETGFLRFGGDVKKEQYNFAGLGAIGGGASGASFDSIRIGIRAQVQHLKAYASTEPLKQEVVDPRFKYVKRGTAQYVQWLGQKENPEGYGWATLENYGNNIFELYIKPMKAL